MAVAELSGESVVVHGQSLALERVLCDFCGGRDFHPFWEVMRYGINLPTVLCKNCGLCMTNPRPTPEANELFNATLYHRFHGKQNLTEYTERSIRLAAPRVSLLQTFVDPQAALSVFEIGTGVGQFQLGTRKATAWNVSGIDANQESAQACRQQGLDVRQAFIEDVSGTATYDVVASFQVLEHIRSPRDFLARARELLKPDGLIYIEVPNLSRPGMGLDRKFQLPHLFNFSATTLRNYLHRAGFESIYVAERVALTMIARRVDRAADGFERYDVKDFMQRLRMVNRIHRLARLIPNVPVLRKIRSTLEVV